VVRGNFSHSGDSGTPTSVSATASASARARFSRSTRRRRWALSCPRPRRSIEFLFTLSLSTARRRSLSSPSLALTSGPLTTSGPSPFPTLNLCPCAYLLCSASPRAFFQPGLWSHRPWHEARMLMFTDFIDLRYHSNSSIGVERLFGCLRGDSPRVDLDGSRCLLAEPCPLHRLLQSWCAEAIGDCRIEGILSNRRFVA